MLVADTGGCDWSAMFLELGCGMYSADEVRLEEIDRVGAMLNPLSAACRPSSFEDARRYCMHGSYVGFGWVHGEGGAGDL